MTAPHKPEARAVDTELSGDDAADHDAAPPTPPEKSTRSRTGVYQFREERWGELYTKKIEQMIAILKSKGVPVLWVGLPAVRGRQGNRRHAVPGFALSRLPPPRLGSPMLMSGKGLSMKPGDFLQQGPDFEGQIRRCGPTTACISPRPVPGSSRISSSAKSPGYWLPTRRRLRCRPNPPAPTQMRAERPLAGPIVPLEASSVGTDQLLGGPAPRPLAVDALAARTLMKGEPLTPPAGRADDFVWPRREVGQEQDQNRAATSRGRARRVEAGHGSDKTPPGHQKVAAC